MRKYVVLAALMVVLIISAMLCYVYQELNNPTKYLSGRDTRKMFGDGSLQIIRAPGTDILNDLEKHQFIEKEVYGYKEIGKMLYVYGRVGFTVIDVTTKSVKQYKANKEKDPNWSLSMQEKYGEKYKIINSFEDFSVEEKEVFNELKDHLKKE